MLQVIHNCVETRFNCAYSGHVTFVLWNMQCTKVLCFLFLAFISY